MRPVFGNPRKHAKITTHPFHHLPDRLGPVVPARLPNPASRSEASEHLNKLRLFGQALRLRLVPVPEHKNRIVAQHDGIRGHEMVPIAGDYIWESPIQDRNRSVEFWVHCGRDAQWQVHVLGEDYSRTDREDIGLCGVSHHRGYLVD